MQICPHDNCWLSAVKGMSHGFHYGCKIRFTHTIVIQMLFGRGSVGNKLRNIVRLSLEHGIILGLYVLCYKGMQCGFANVLGKRSPIHALVAGAIGGGLFFSRQSSVTSQINLYLLSRIVSGIVNVLYKAKVIPNSDFVDNWGFAVVSVLCWGVVMSLFEMDSGSLQPSLQNSMQFLYKESDVVEENEELVPFLKQIMGIVRWVKGE